MAELSVFPRAGAYAQIDRRLVVRVLLAVVLLGVVAIVGPLISYRSDVAEVDRVFDQRISREAHVYAAALSAHFRMLESELERLAARPEINLFDNSLAPEKELLAFTHHNSALFSAVAVLDAQGRVLWSEPHGALAEGATFAEHAWFQHVLAHQRPAMDVLARRSRAFAVAAPVLRAGKTVGVVAGLIEATGQLFPGGRPEGEHLELLVTSRDGDIFLPETPPDWAKAETYPTLLSAALKSDGTQVISVNGHDRYIAATPVGETGLALVLSADKAAVISPMRNRFLAQLVFIVILQGLTVLLFAAYLRSTYGAFLRMETHAAQQEKMAALGSAASLIAHEVKNSLNGLKAAASLVESGGDVSLPVKSMRGQINRLGHLASSLLHFGKPATPQVVSTELNQVVRDAVEGAGVLPEREEVNLTMSLGPAVHVHCDPLLLMTALDNLIRNAVEAAAVAKDLGKVASPAVQVKVHVDETAANVVVEDNAGGPPRDFDARLFQPFVTSKPKGIGLGLSMARQAVEQQGGRIQFERTAEGSRFTVVLPLGGSA